MWLVAAAVAHAIAGAVTPAALDVHAGSVAALGVGAALYLVAGVLRLTRGRVFEDRRSVLMGSALIVMGVLCLPVGRLAMLLHPGPGAVAGPALRCLVTLVAMFLVLQVLSDEDQGHRSSLRVVRYGLAAAAAICVVLPVVDDFYVPDADLVAITGLVIGALRTLGWLLLAVLAARTDRQPWARRLAPLLLGMGLAEVLRTLDAGRSDTWALGALLTCAGMAALATRNALRDMGAAIRHERLRRAELARELDEVSVEAQQLSRWREQLTHDARNAVAGLRAAMTVLEEFDGRVDPLTAARLRLAAIDEIGHIEHLLTRSQVAAPETFEVTGLLGSVATATRAMGLDVSVTGEPVEAIGRPQDLAAVVRNLLGNARVHAPGACVHLSVGTDDGLVRVVCADHGPGVRPEDAPHVFERGYRGVDSPGEGLGLHGARVLMREQGGELALDPTGPGARFVLTLPAARALANSPRVRRTTTAETP